MYHIDPRYKSSSVDDYAKSPLLIKNDKQYNLMLSILEPLLDDYSDNEVLIDIISNAISHWELTSPEFKEFNKNIKLNK